MKMLDIIINKRVIGYLKVKVQVPDGLPDDQIAQTVRKKLNDDEYEISELIDWEDTNDEYASLAEVIPSETVKPPLGITPREIVIARRQREIIDAVKRFNDAGVQIPNEWLDELKELNGLFSY